MRDKETPQPAEPTETSELLATVRKLRIALDDTQQEFAQRLGLAIATVIRYEHNRPPRAKALAKLERVATAHGLDEFAAVFRQALGDELGAPPPTPTGLTIQLKDEEEKKLALALLDVLRKPFYEKEAKSVRRILIPVADKRQRDAEFSEAIETSKLAIVRLLKGGHTAEEIKNRTGMSTEKIAEAFFDRGGPKFFGGPKEFEKRMKEIVALLLKDGWGIRYMADKFSQGEADEFLSIAHELQAWDAVSDYEQSQKEEND